MIQQATAWREACLLDKTLSKWRIRLEEREDEEIKPKLLIADAYSKDKYKAKYFSIWYKYPVEVIGDRVCGLRRDLLWREFDKEREK